MKIEKTKHFEKWFKKLDMSIKVRLLGYINRLADGNFSGCEPVGEGIHELRIFFQKGYRIYFTNSNNTIVLLLYGGNKDTQQKDIKKAKEIKKNLGG